MIGTIQEYFINIHLVEGIPASTPANTRSVYVSFFTFCPRSRTPPNPAPTPNPHPYPTECLML